MTDVERLQQELAKITAEHDELRTVCAEAYQVVGSLLSDLGKFETTEAERILDNLSEARLVHTDVLPWPSFMKQ